MLERPTATHTEPRHSNWSCLCSTQELKERAMRLDCGATLNLRENDAHENCGAPSASHCEFQTENPPWRSGKNM
jgi:hypothetical protein